jgi:hypothetical protein
MLTRESGSMRNRKVYVRDKINYLFAKSEGAETINKRASSPMDSP